MTKVFRISSFSFHSGNWKSAIKNPKCLLLATFFLTTVSLAESQQQSKNARIGVLRVDSQTSPVAMESIGSLKQGLTNLGYLDGKNISFELRWAENNINRLPILAAELVQLKVDIIVTSGPQAIRAVKEVTSTIPVVMGRMDDVVEHGLVASLARPGGNITGLSFQTGELGGKWLDLLKDVLPRLSRVAALWDTSSTAGQVRTVEETGRAMGVRLEVLKVQGLDDFERAFVAAKKLRTEGLIILASPILTAQRTRLAELATRDRLPAIYYHEGFAEAGGLLAYGPKQSEFSWRRSAIFVDKILKGTKPEDLPVEQPTKFEFVINLKTAKQIGLTIPPNVLVRADRVIK